MKLAENIIIGAISLFVVYFTMKTMFNNQSKDVVRKSSKKTKPTIVDHIVGNNNTVSVYV